MLRAAARSRAPCRASSSRLRTLTRSASSLSESAHSRRCTPISSALEKAADLLPHQGILENFIHHNPLSHLESLKFKDALEHVKQLESYMSPGERVLSLVHVDPRKRVNEALADLSSGFLDRGAAQWAAPNREKGFLYFFGSLESLGFAPWRRHARAAAKRIMKELAQQADSSVIAELIIEENLKFFGVPPEQWPDSMRAMLLELRGWSGMFHRMETHPNEAPANTTVRLLDFCAVQSILVRSSVEALARRSGWTGTDAPLAEWLGKAPTHRPLETEITKHSSGIAYVDQSSERREVLETEFKHTLLNGIGTKPTAEPTHRPELQLYTCIDDRECSFRRHVEDESATGIETFGVAGFFGIPIRYEPADGRGEMTLAPEGLHPSAILVERQRPDDELSKTYARRRRIIGRIASAWERASFSPLGSAFLSLLSPLSVLRLLMIGFAPATKQSIEDWFMCRFLPRPHTDFQLPFPADQAATMLARTFKDIGTHRRFAPIVMVLGHGAVSVNNPFAAAYNCGACGGREGGPNARLLARLANNAEVRRCLRLDHDIAVPDDTIFIGGLHNTTTDTVEFFDVHLLPDSHREAFAKAQAQVQRALGKNALERCKRFLLATAVNTAEAALRHVKLRATDLAEVRPELNHATNAAVVVGRRGLTKGRFLDRRVFLPSYDPSSDDSTGTNLEHVLTPALIVCSGINLEYLFSTISVDGHGAGTKAPLNIVGNIGVLQGTAGDLRPGLPSQMTEMHTPVRALYVVDAPVERVEAVLNRREQLLRLVRNEWVRLFVRDPITNRFFRQVDGKYLPMDPMEAAECIPFTAHRTYALSVARREALVYTAAMAGMALSCIVPILQFGAQAMNPYGSVIAACGTLLGLPVLAYSRRYLHGERKFGRFASLCVGLLTGFNIVATAPSLAVAMGGWSLFGFASTFLIGAYNDRPTVRNNATYAFTAYKISDMALLVAATFSALNPPVAAAGLLVAALLKSSQFPLTSLFVRSMEGPTPASALGYAGLSAHVGVVLLTSTMALWYPYEWARIALGSVGLFTAAYATLQSKIRADRKGAIANATSATLGLIFVTLAMGHAQLALWLSLGHAAFRMIQIMRSPNVIADTQNIRSALGNGTPWPRIVPAWLYRLSWRVRRIDTDLQFIFALHWISRKLPRDVKLNKWQQWLVTGCGVVLAGAPYTPLSHFFEEHFMELLPSHPFIASVLMLAHAGVSVVIIRFLLLRVLHARRFNKDHKKV